MQRAAIERLLPGVIQQTSLPTSALYALLEAMEDLHAPSEDALDHLEAYFNPYLAPDEFLPYLTRWVDLDWLLGDAPPASPVAATTEFPGGPDGLRDLIAYGAYLAHWRGTETGLLLLLRLATGKQGFAVAPAVDEAGNALPFRVALTAPDGSSRYRELVERIIHREKPAHIEVDIAFVGE